MEDIVLLETMLACPDKKVFKLQFPIGEYDMVVFDPKELRYGDIRRKYVIYRRNAGSCGDVHYLNVEEYLKSLGNNII